MQSSYCHQRTQIPGGGSNKEREQHRSSSRLDHQIAEDQEKRKSRKKSKMGVLQEVRKKNCKPPVMPDNFT